MITKLKDFLGIIIYKIVAWLFFAFYRLFYGLQIKGKDNLPLKEPFIIIANHQHLLDPTVVGAAVYPKQVHFMAKEELFKNFLFRWVFTAIGTFPVKRGRADLQAFRTSYQKIKEGKVLGMFPEGTRQKPGEQGKAKKGAAQIVKRTGVKVVPVRVDWNNWRRPIKVFIGKPIGSEDFPKKESKDQLGDLAEFLMEQVRGLK